LGQDASAREVAGGGIGGDSLSNQGTQLSAMFSLPASSIFVFLYRGQRMLDQLVKRFQ
jgi:hypothetical protein